MLAPAVTQAQAVMVEMAATAVRPRQALAVMAATLAPARTLA